MNTRYKNKILKKEILKRFFRNYLIKNKCFPKNKEDPILLENFSELIDAGNSLIRIIDDFSSVFLFDAVAFAGFLNNGGDFNPLTRRKLLPVEKTRVSRVSGVLIATKQPTAEGYVYYRNSIYNIINILLSEMTNESNTLWDGLLGTLEIHMVEFQVNNPVEFEGIMTDILIYALGHLRSANFPVGRVLSLISVLDINFNNVGLGIEPAPPSVSRMFDRFIQSTIGTTGENSNQAEQVPDLPRLFPSTRRNNISYERNFVFRAQAPYRLLVNRGQDNSEGGIAAAANTQLPLSPVGPVHNDFRIQEVRRSSIRPPLIAPSDPVPPPDEPVRTPSPYTPPPDSPPPLSRQDARGVSAHNRIARAQLPIMPLFHDNIENFDEIGDDLANELEEMDWTSY